MQAASCVCAPRRGTCHLGSGAPLLYVLFHGSLRRRFDRVFLSLFVRILYAFRAHSVYRALADIPGAGISKTVILLLGQIQG